MEISVKSVKGILEKHNLILRSGVTITENRQVCPLGACLVEKLGFEGALERYTKDSDESIEQVLSKELDLSPKWVESFIEGFDFTDVTDVVNPGYHLGRHLRSELYEGEREAGSPDSETVTGD